MFEQVITALALAQQSPEDADAALGTLERIVTKVCKRADGSEMLLLEMIGFVGTLCLDAAPLVEVLGKAMSGRIGLAVALRQLPDRSSDARSRFRAFAADGALTAPRVSTRGDVPPPGTVRVAALAPPPKRRRM